MKNGVKTGGVGIWLDEIVPCLRDTETGEIKETVVYKIESRSFLRKFKEKDGWGINWIEIPSDVEAVYLHWACSAPQNNKHAFGCQKYSGVGGHLFAIAVDKAVQWGYRGVVHGFALNEELLNHYIVALGASYLGAQHPYQFLLDGDAARKLLEVYTYEWN